MQEKNIITQTKKEFQSMLSTFSHEIRNPLALITSEMQMLSDSQPQLCFNEHWDNIMENLNYIRELLDELSALLKETGRVNDNMLNHWYVSHNRMLSPT